VGLLTALPALILNELRPSTAFQIQVQTTDLRLTTARDGISLLPPRTRAVYVKITGPPWVRIPASRAHPLVTASDRRKVATPVILESVNPQDAMAIDGFGVAAGIKIHLRHNVRADRYELSCKSPDGQHVARGLKIDIPELARVIGLDRTELLVSPAPGEALFTPATTDSLVIGFRTIDNSQDVLLRGLAVKEVSFSNRSFGVDERFTPRGYQSSILGGTVFLDAIEGESYRVRPGEVLVARELEEATLNRVHGDDAVLHVSIVGKSKTIDAGTFLSRKNISPTLLDIVTKTERGKIMIGLYLGLLLILLEFFLDPRSVTTPTGQEQTPPRDDEAS
jgi:hypothetical protein